MLAQVSIVTGAQSNALLVPREALLGTPTPNGLATVVTLDGGRAERKSVRLGLVTDQSVEVTSGLVDGQVVAIGNASSLNNGDAVVPQLRTALATSGAQQ
jgi:HlyD family secretion protein